MEPVARLCGTNPRNLEEAKLETDIPKHQILETQLITKGIVEFRKTVYFCYPLDEKKYIITIFLEPEDIKAGVTLVASCSEQYVSKEKCDWRVLSYQPLMIEILPSDSRLSGDMLYIGVIGEREGKHFFTIQIRLSEVPPICSLRNGVSHKFQIQPKEYAYFSYNMKEAGIESILAFFASPGSDKIELFASTTTPYPTKKGNNFETTSSKTSPFGERSEVELQPFVLNNHLGCIQYRSASSTSLPSNSKSSSLVSVFLDGSHWKYLNRNCYISVLSKSDTPEDCTIYPEESTEKHILCFFLIRDIIVTTYNS